MPIYAYKCGSCGHAKDVLQKISDAPLSVCPACGAAAFAKQVTAAGFQLKGSGWYATDFRGGSKSAAGATNDAPASGESRSGESKSDGGAGKPADSGSGTAKSDSPAAAAGGCGGACACH